MRYFAFIRTLWEMKRGTLLFGITVVSTTALFFVANAFFQKEPFVTQPSSSTDVEAVVGLVPEAVPEAALPQPHHVPLPEEVRGLYWTANTAGSARRGKELLSYMLDRGLNTVVIDLKMDNGSLAFTPHDEALLPYAMKNPAIDDLDGLLGTLSEKGIYRIARIAVMRDSAFAAAQPDAALRRIGGGLWRDRTGSLWLDPMMVEVAEYAIALGKEAFARGFDEVQFDYIRFPSDGALGSVVYPLYDRKRPREEIIADFFREVGGTLRPQGIPVSFDLFGLVMVSSSGIGVGQRLADVSPFADFISPMVYPSHYASGFRGHTKPALYPYDVVKASLDKGLAQLVLIGVSPDIARRQFRPWLQDFDIGATYTAEMIEAQIQAARDAGASGWLLWNARNVYEPARYMPSEDGG